MFGSLPAPVLELLLLTPGLMRAACNHETLTEVDMPRSESSNSSVPIYCLVTHENDLQHFL